MGIAIAGRTCATASGAPRGSRWPPDHGCQPLTGRSATSTLFPGEQPLTGKRPVSPANGSPWGRVTNADPGQVPVEGQGLVLRLSDGALDIAQGLLGAALDLPTLAADLLLLAPGHLAEPFLDFAPGLAQRAFDVLIGHGNVPSAVLPLVVRTPHTMEASPGARASGVPAAHASLSSRPNHVMTVRHGAW